MSKVCAAGDSRLERCSCRRAPPLPVAEWKAANPERVLLGYSERRHRDFPESWYLLKVYEEESPVLIDAKGGEIPPSVADRAVPTQRRPRTARLSRKLPRPGRRTPDPAILRRRVPARRGPAGGTADRAVRCRRAGVAQENRDSMTAWVADANAPVVSLLGEIGATIEYVSQAAPIVYAVVPGTHLLSVLKTSQVVDHVESAAYDFEYYTTGNDAAKLRTSMPRMAKAMGCRCHRRPGHAGAQLETVAQPVHRAWRLGGTSAEADPGLMPVLRRPW